MKQVKLLIFIILAVFVSSCTDNSLNNEIKIGDNIEELYNKGICQRDLQSLEWTITNKNFLGVNFQEASVILQEDKKSVLGITYINTTVMPNNDEQEKIQFEYNELRKKLISKYGQGENKETLIDGATSLGTIWVSGNVEISLFTINNVQFSTTVVISRQKTSIINDESTDAPNYNDILNLYSKDGDSLLFNNIPLSEGAEAIKHNILELGFSLLYDHGFDEIKGKKIKTLLYKLKNPDIDLFNKLSYNIYKGFNYKDPFEISIATAENVNGEIIAITISLVDEDGITINLSKDDCPKLLEKFSRQFTIDESTDHANTYTDKYGNHFIVDKNSIAFNLIKGELFWK